MAILKVVSKDGVLITDEGDRIVDEKGNGFAISIYSYILKANGKIIVVRNNNN